MARRLDFSRIKTATVRGKKFRMVWRKPRKTKDRDWQASADSPHTKDKAIYVGTKVHPEDVHTMIVHELAHATWFDLSEESVTQFSLDLRRLLRRMGFRPVFEPAKKKRNHQHPDELFE